MGGVNIVFCRAAGSRRVWRGLKKRSGYIWVGRYMKSALLYDFMLILLCSLPEAYAIVLSICHGVSIGLESGIQNYASRDLYFFFSPHVSLRRLL